MLLSHGVYMNSSKHLNLQMTQIHSEKNEGERDENLVHFEKEVR